MMPYLRTAWRPFLLVPLCLALAACSKPEPEPPPVVRPVKMLTIGGELRGTVEYPGRLRAAQQVDMGFEVPGRIIEFVFTEGSRVAEGASLARLDPRDYQNLRQQAIAQENQAQSYRDRIALAHETNAVAGQDLTNAEAQLEVAEAEVRIRQKALDDTELIAPFDGIMSRKLVEDFANVLAKQAVLVFEDPSHFEIKVSVPERDLAGRRRRDDTPDQITKRIQPEVTVTALPERRFPARLKELATTADPTTRTFEATFVFESPEDVIVLPGMTAKVQVRRGGADRAVAVPVQAVVADPAGTAMVWIVESSSMAVSRRRVVMGELVGNSARIESGLADGDVIAISGIAQLREGMVVSRWER